MLCWYSSWGSVCPLLGAKTVVASVVDTVSTGFWPIKASNENLRIGLLKFWLGGWGHLKAQSPHHWTTGEFP